MLKHQTICLFITALLISTVGALPSNAHNNVEPEKDGLFFVGTQSAAAKAVTSFHSALQQGDTKTARELLADNVIIFEGGRVERTADEYAQHHMLSDIKYLAGLKITLLEHQVFTNGDTAYSVAKSQSIGLYKAKEINSISLETMTLKKIGSGWKITHIHWSN